MSNKSNLSSPLSVQNSATHPPNISLLRYGRRFPRPLTHLLLSLLLAFVAAIPNHILRYTALGLLFVLVALCTVHLHSPSAQLHHLAHLIERQTEDLIRRAIGQCPRDYFSLTEEMGRLLDLSISAIQFDELETNADVIGYSARMIAQAISNHTLRYTALGLLFVLTVLCTVHLPSPSTQLLRLAYLRDKTEDLIRHAREQCPRDYFSLTEEMGQLLEANKTASLLKCRNLDSKGEQFTWNKYRELCKDIAACAKRVNKTRTAVLRIVEVGHQRKLEDDIKGTQFILTAAHAASLV
ncbi:hypothetical protein B0H13DRAFT_2353971 [Mycena leptocephala]|nr:hypothetical protein B0H13DRAFT_2353971 [Mycena leptocephala]